MMSFNFFDRFLFGFAPIFITLIFVIVMVGLIFAVVGGAKTWSHNNAQPVLTVWAKVVTKRTNVSSSMHHHDDMHHHSSSTTSYFVTFEVESGDRMEFGVTGDEFGVLVEGDRGKLTFQGTRYKVFSRDRGE